MSVIDIAIYVVLGLMGLGMLTIVVFGIRSLVYGKVSLSTMAFICAPFVLLAVLGFAVLDSWAEAGIMTIAITLAASLLGLFATGIKNLFS